MTTERTELAGLIMGRTTTDAVERIIAAGYRKPPTIDNDKLVIDDGLLLLDVGECTCTPYGSSHECQCGVEYLDDLTKPLERAGYTKPRQVTTVEELDALPVGSVTLSSNGAVSEKVFDGPVRGWRMTGDGAHHEPPALPATVLYSPVVAP